MVKQVSGCLLLGKPARRGRRRSVCPICTSSVPPLPVAYPRNLSHSSETRRKKRRRRYRRKIFLPIVALCVNACQFWRGAVVGHQWRAKALLVSRGGPFMSRLVCPITLGGCVRGPIGITYGIHGILCSRASGCTGSRLIIDL